MTTTEHTNGAAPPSAPKAAAETAGEGSPATTESAAANPFDGKPLFWRLGWDAKYLGIPRDKPPRDLHGEILSEWRAGYDAFMEGKVGAQ